MILNGPMEPLSSQDQTLNSVHHTALVSQMAGRAISPPGHLGPEVLEGGLDLSLTERGASRFSRTRVSKPRLK